MPLVRQILAHWHTIAANLYRLTAARGNASPPTPTGKEPMR